MKALLDTCVVLDLLQKREPFTIVAREIFRAAAGEKFECFFTVKELTDIYYLTHHVTHDDKETRRILGQLLEFVSLSDSIASDALLALASPMADFEDALMAETAARTGMDCIVTRNLKDYARSPVKALSPAEFLSRLQ